MYLKTSHGTFVVVDRDDGRLRHLAFAAASGHTMVDLPEDVVAADAAGATMAGGSPVLSGPLSGYLVYRSKSENGFHLVKNGFFLCADLRTEVVTNRVTPGPWELFTLSDPDLERAQPKPDAHEATPCSPGVRSDHRTSRRIVVSSNCQTGGVTGTLMALLSGDEISPFPLPSADDAKRLEELAGYLNGRDLWVTADPSVLSQHFAAPGFAVPRVVPLPTIHFDAFHPDITYLRDDITGQIVAPDYNSAIIAWAWKHGLSQAQTATLFAEEIYTALGYCERWEPAMHRLRQDFERTGLNPAEFILPLKRQGLFMHSLNHPHASAMVQLGKLVAREITGDASLLNRHVEIEVGVIGDIWPVYPGVGDALGLVSSLNWMQQSKYYDLAGFIARSFGVYEARGIAPDQLVFLRSAEQVARLDAVLGGMTL